MGGGRARQTSAHVRPWADARERQIGSADSADGSTAAGPLTEREREVVALIVRSSTNRKIAERAGDRRGRPCPNILNKLNLHSRAQVAVWTMEQARPVP